MKPLPTWVPKVSRPFNPDYANTWDKMSDNEKRWSFLVDVVIVGVVILLLSLAPMLGGRPQ